MLTRRFASCMVVLAWLATAASAQVIEIRLPRERIAAHIETLRREPIERLPRPARLTSDGWLAHDGTVLHASHPELLDHIQRIDPHLFGALAPNATRISFARGLTEAERTKRFRGLLEKLQTQKARVRVVLPDPGLVSGPERFDALITTFRERNGLRQPIQARVAVVKTDLAAYLSQKNDPSALVVIEKTSHPTQGVLALEERVERVHVIDALARTPEEYERAHRKPGDAKDLSVDPAFEASLGDSVERFEIDPEATPTNGREIAARARSALENRKPGETVVIIAHYEDGVARMTDGSALETGVISKFHGVLIGCETVKGLQLVSDIHVVTTRPLSFSEGRDMAIDFANAVRDGVQTSDATVRHMLQQVQRVWNSRSKKPTIKLIVKRDRVRHDEGRRS